MPKYELEITQADIQALREVLADTLDGTESDEDIVRECFTSPDTVLKLTYATK